MQYRIIFSAYINNTGTDTRQQDIVKYLNKLSKINNIDGYSLNNQVGYWQGTNETSYILDLIDVTKNKASKIAKNIKKHYHQDAVILQPVKITSEFI